MTSRRNFLAGAAALGTLPVARVWAARTSGPEFPFAEFEQRIARRDFRGMTKDILPTPCIVVDLDMFKANVQHVADTAKANGINVRPHVKIHKSVDVAKHQMAAGPSGSPAPPSPRPSCFPARASRAFCGPSSPPASTTSSAPCALQEGPHLHVCGRRPAGGRLGGTRRQRPTKPKPASRCRCMPAWRGRASTAASPQLAWRKKSTPPSTCSFEGFMAYSGAAAHTKGFENRTEALAWKCSPGARESKDQAQKAGLAREHHVRRLHRHLQHRS